MSQVRNRVLPTVDTPPSTASGVARKASGRPARTALSDEALARSEQRRGAESARRALRLLLCFSKEHHTLSPAQLAAMTGIPLPTTYRYVSSLREMGLLVAAPHGNLYLSPRFMALGQAAQAAETLNALADPVMRRLALECGETVLLVRLIASAAICVHRVESCHSLRTSFEPGQPLSLRRGASAKVLLASLDGPDLDAQLKEFDLSDGADATRRLRGEVAFVREHGYATSEAEIDDGIWAAAAPVRDTTGIVAALSIPAPLVRAQGERQEWLIGLVTTSAQDISGLLR